MNASVRLLCFCRSSVLVSVKVSVKASVKVSVKKKHTKTHKNAKNTQRSHFMLRSTSHVVTDIEPDVIDVKS